MKDIRFYLEFPSAAAKHKSGKAHIGHSGNVLAAFTAGPDLYERTHGPGDSPEIVREIGPKGGITS